MSIPYITTVLTCPLAGMLIDKYCNHRLKFSLISSVLLLSVHMLFLNTTMNPIVILILQGLSYSIFLTSIYPILPLLVNKKYIGIAYGVVISIQNLGFSIFPIVIAIIYNYSFKKYIPNINYFFIIVSMMSFFIGLYLNCFDINLSSDTSYNSYNSHNSYQSYTTYTSNIPNATWFQKFKSIISKKYRYSIKNTMRSINKTKKIIENTKNKNNNNIYEFDIDIVDT